MNTYRNLYQEISTLLKLNTTQPHHTDITISDLETLIQSTFNSGYTTARTFSKIALLCALNGFWSFSLEAFIKAIELQHSNEEQIPPACLPDKAAIDECLTGTKALGHLRDHEISSVPLPIIVRFYFLLLTAKDFDLPEALPAIHKLSSLRNELANIQDTAITEKLFDEFCKERWFESSIPHILAALHN